MKMIFFGNVFRII